jgi:O-antigen/teichoic acid export membrane protein
MSPPEPSSPLVAPPVAIEGRVCPKGERCIRIVTPAFPGAHARAFFGTVPLPIVTRSRAMSETASRMGHALVRGSFWVSLGQMIGTLSGLASSIVAARLLDPAAFGLIGIALMVIATLHALSQTGFEQALIQRKDVEEYIGAAFAVQIIRGIFLATILLLAARPLAWFYEEPVLLPILMVMSASVLISSFRNVATVFFHRTLDFGQLVLLGTAKALGKLGIVVILLLSLRNVWALVLGHLSSTLIDVGLSYLIQRRRVLPIWDRSKASELLKFGKWVSAMGVLGLFVLRGDDMVIGKYLGVSALGLYAVAYELANVPATHVTHVIGKVSFPAYSRLHNAGARAELREMFFRVAKATLLITAPISAFIFLGIESIVEHILGSSWQPIIPLVKILVVAGFVRSTVALATGIFHGAGRPHLDFWMNLPRFILLVGLIVPACAFFGLEGACWLVLLAISSCLPSWYIGLRDIARISLLDLRREAALPLIATTVIVMAYLSSELLVAPATLLRFVVQVAVAFTLFCFGMWIVGRWTRFQLFSEVAALSRAMRARPA